jgi:hypothetical protein
MTMALTGKELKQLESEAREMVTDGDRGYLADALEHLRDTGDPIEALRLLRSMWGSGHAKRVDQKHALNRVGRWLENRLTREPGVAVARLALELGWLRRMATYQNSRRQVREQRESKGKAESKPRSQGPGSTVVNPGFGDQAHIKQLVQRRERAIALSRKQVETVAAPVSVAAEPARKVPERLPDELDMQLALASDALQAWKTARERQKKGKPAKDRKLAIVPVVAELQGMARGTELVPGRCVLDTLACQGKLHG